jgi:hypothetical protein
MILDAGTQFTLRSLTETVEGAFRESTWPGLLPQ